MEINRNTYEEFFLLYVDGELNAGERKAVEDFAELHPDLKQELEMLKMSILVADQEIVFEKKEKLYKEERKIIASGWWKMIAAAILLIGFATSGWLYLINEPSKQAVVAGLDKNTPKVSSATEDQEPVKRTDIPGTKEQNGEEKVIKTADIREAGKAGASAKNKTIEKNNDAQPQKIEPADVTNSIDEPSHNNIEISILDVPKEIIDIDVAPQTLNANIEETAVNVSYAAHETVDQSANNDMIYFANTSVPKRNKFRGVFRKATRIIDKVTSLQ